MEVTIEGRGTYTLALTAGDLTISLDGRVLLTTKGNPTKRGNPAFTSLDEAHTYFQSLAISQPIVADTPEV